MVIAGVTTPWRFQQVSEEGRGRKGGQALEWYQYKYNHIDFPDGLAEILNS